MLGAHADSEPSGRATPRRFALLAIAVLALGGGLLSGPAGLRTPEAASAHYVSCGFGPIDDRLIAVRRHISCSEAKRVLLELKGHRRAHTIPMVCGRPRMVHGWRLVNDARSFSTVSNVYQRGKVSFVYERAQRAGHEWCRPPYGTGEDIG